MHLVTTIAFKDNLGDPGRRNVVVVSWQRIKDDFGNLWETLMSYSRAFAGNIPQRFWNGACMSLIARNAIKLHLFYFIFSRKISKIEYFNIIYSKNLTSFFNLLYSRILARATYCNLIYSRNLTRIAYFNLI